MRTRNGSWSWAVGLSLIGAGCVGNIGDGSAGAGTLGASGPSGVGPYRWQRLTIEQFDNTVRDLLGNDARLASQKFSSEGYGSSGFATPGLVGSLDVERFAAVAHTLAEQAMPDLVPGRLLPCDPSGGEDACASAFIEQFGARCFRRPLGDDEVADYLALYALARADLGDDFAGALALVIEAMLQSPAFLYLGEPIGAEPAIDGRIALGPYEIASRMSYFLWNTMPDPELTAAAEQGALQDPASLAAEVERMLADDKATDAIRTFTTQWLGLAKLTGIVKADPTFTDAVKAAAAEETLRFVRFVLLQGDGKLSTLLGAPFSFVNADLAPFYGVDVQGTEFVQVELPNRWGVLTQMSVLAAHASATEDNPIFRGKLVRQGLLCHELGAPPPNIPDLPPPSPDSTNRQLHEQHVADPYCKSCHTFMDPIGFGFGNYDATGRFRTEYPDGVPVDVTGMVVAIDGADRAFEGPEELIDLLTHSEQVKACVVKKWFRFGFGRAETEGDEASIEEIARTFAESDHDIRALLAAIVQSPSFKNRPHAP